MGQQFIAIRYSYEFFCFVYFDNGTESDCCVCGVCVVPVDMPAIKMYRLRKVCALSSKETMVRYDVTCRGMACTVLKKINVLAMRM